MCVRDMPDSELTESGLRDKYLLRAAPAMLAALENADGDFYLAMMGEGSLEAAQRQVREAIRIAQPPTPKRAFTKEGD